MDTIEKKILAELLQEAKSVSFFCLKGKPMTERVHPAIMMQRNKTYLLSHAIVMTNSQCNHYVTIDAKETNYITSYNGFFSDEKEISMPMQIDGYAVF